MATEIISPSLYTLPIELIYRILDILDNKTILFSFGNVCTRFHSIIHTYNQYNFNFKSISKPYFHSLCYLIQPENIISLTLSNDNQTPEQIQLFLLLFQRQQFTRLRSLTLIEINENDFHTIFQQSQNIISSLSFTFQKNTLYNLKTLPLISSIISNTNLRHLDFTLLWNQIDDLSWPKQCLLQSLIISNRINFNQFSIILSHSLQLKKFVLQDCKINELVNIHSFISYPQLISLTFDSSELNMNECEYILSLIPSLEYFQIVGGINLSDGFRWEQFIQIKLLKLNKFEFAFCGNTDSILEDVINVESLINSFRTPFWIENKHWFVVCYYFKETTNYSLYSLPICRSNVRFYPQKDKISCSTYCNLNIDKTLTDNVHEMQLNLTNLMASDNGNEKMTSSNYPFFRQLNKLVLCIDNEWPIGSVEHLSTFIDFSCVVEISITIEFYPESVSNTLDNLINLFKQTCHLYSLTIESSSVNAENICLIIPDYVKHLQVSVKNIDDIKIIINQLKHLSSITFELLNGLKLSSTEFLSWLMENRNKSTCRIENNFVSIWFDKINLQIH